ncbi:MAG: DUF1080 domain-containing protein [Saprospiraceae bacterium]|nr:DUF1080 domain-containing protein [Saprospiraceae bacterium]
MNPTLQKLSCLVLLLILSTRCAQDGRDADTTSPGDQGAPISPSQEADYVNWPVYRGDHKGNQYAELAQIHAANVHRLEPIWQYRTGDASERSSMQVNPIIVDGLLYISTSTLRAVAIDAATGSEVWTFHSQKYNRDQELIRGRSRGVTYWASEDGKDQRIFHFVKDRVYAIQAKTGELITDFGTGGHIDLRQNMGMDPEEVSIEVTTPGVVYKNTLIVTSRVPEGYQSTPGHIKAYDATTGAFKWIFHTIPQEGEFGYDTWQFEEGETYGGANAWGGLTVDEKRGWVFCATGSPAYDFFGGYRKGNNLFGNCVLALEAETGERIWHYQTVRHDIWDYDNPSAPILVTIGKGKGQQEAVVQLTKMGLTFVLDRDTGEPLFPVEELNVPPSTIDGEEASPTQPFPLKPPPLNQLGMTEADLTQISEAAHTKAYEDFQRYRAGALYEPPSAAGTITAPGLFGGVEWHGGSFDPYTSILYVNANNAATISKLHKVHDLDDLSQASTLQKGRQVYLQNCASCHGLARKGVPPTYPNIEHPEKSAQEIQAMIRNGKNIMPAFPQLQEEDIDAVTEYILSDEEILEGIGPKGKVRYLHEGYDRLVDHQGFPAVAPPWGTLNAIDLKTGTFFWRKPLGQYPQLVKQGIRNTGTLNYGGALATAGGIVFIAATADEKFRAFEKVTGKLLWEYQLPVGAYATPSIYTLAGRQYVALVAGGGGKNGTPSGDYVMAFALPESYLSNRQAPKEAVPNADGWISLFNGKNLDGWVQMNGSHSYKVENGAIIGRTTVGSENSFLCSLQEFDDFEFTCDVQVDTITNQGVQFRSSARPVSEKDHPNFRAGRVWGPQLEIRRNMGLGKITTGVLYGEALGTGWLSSEEKLKDSHDYYIPDAWNRIRILAEGPRMRTFLNGRLIEDIANEDVYRTHPKGFIALQIHGIDGERPFEMAWRDLKIRPLSLVE